MKIQIAMKPKNKPDTPPSEDMSKSNKLTSQTEEEEDMCMYGDTEELVTPIKKVF